MLDILTFRHARYSNLKGCPIFEHCRADRHWKLSGCSIFKLFGPFDIQIVFGLLDIQSFRAARYSNFSGRSTFKVCGLMQSVRAARYSTFSGCSIFKVFGLLDVLTFRAAWYPKLKAVRCSNFSRLPVDIQSFRAARYSNFRGCSVFEILCASRNPTSPSQTRF